MCPLFHLVTVCTKKQNNGDLESIDALLGCAVSIPESDIAEKMSGLGQREKDVVCASLFLCINWFREVINSFASIDTAEVKAKVCYDRKRNFVFT